MALTSNSIRESLGHNDLGIARPFVDGFDTRVKGSIQWTTPFKSLTDTVMDFVHEKMYINDILHRNVIGGKIGSLTSKNMLFTRATLMRNIGSHDNDYDGYATPIGEYSDPLYNSSIIPWFITDNYKNNNQDYLDYIEQTYGKTINKSLFTTEGERQESFELSNKDSEYSKVAVIRDYDYASPKTLAPNNLPDSQLGYISGFYLQQTLQNAFDYYKEHHGSTATPTLGDNDLATNKPSITQGAYAAFATGPFSMSRGRGPEIGKVRNPDEYIGNVIPWSTADHNYDSDYLNGRMNNQTMVSQMLNLNTSEDVNNITLKSTDKSQDTPAGYTYYPFGNYYSITYSLGLITTSSQQTKEFIARSMLGYPLLKDIGDVDAIKDFNWGEGAIKDAPKKYYAGEGTKGTTYIGKITRECVDEIKFDGNVVRLVMVDAGSDNMWANHTSYYYSEAEGNTEGSPYTGEDNPGNAGVVNGKVKPFNVEFSQESKLQAQDIVQFTNTKFNQGKYDTLIARFHSDEFKDGPTGARANRDITQTAISQYGMSHGRNLLKKDHKGAKTNGYSNPYCRVWTYHHQYSTYQDVIRPFPSSGNLANNSYFMSYRMREGQDNLSKYGVKTELGLVRYAPTKTDKDSNDIRRCMFSIENLAWRNNSMDLSERIWEDEKGPNGGRIMWFPPYDLKFNENVNVQWNGTQFIGRGEKIYTYTDTERSGNLSFKMLIDHPSIINSFRQETNGTIGDVDDTESEEQALLRFFAGCEILAQDAAPKPQDEKKKEQAKKPEEPKPAPPITVPTPEPEKIVFYVYFPNNYSGVDEVKEDPINGGANAMGYLINGVDAGIGEDGSKFTFPLSDPKNGRGYEIAKNGIGGSRTSPKGITIHSEYKIDTTVFGNSLPGINSKYNTESIKYLANEAKQEGVDYKGTKYICQYWAKNKGGRKNFWGHRVDKRVANEVMYTHGNSNENYSDYANYGLNGEHYIDVLSIHPESQQYEVDGYLYSFADVYCAISGNDALITALGDDVIKDNVTALREKFDNFEVRNVEVKGFASSHGYKSSNNTLINDRANTVANWLSNAQSVKYVKSDNNFETKYGKIGGTFNKVNNNDKVAKLWRSVEVIMYLEPQKVEEPNDERAENIKSNINYHDNVAQQMIDNAVGIVEDEHITTQKELKAKHPGLTDIALLGSIQAIENEAALIENDDKTDLHKVTDHDGYGSEYKFFKEFVDKDDLLRHRVVDKIKYFDPAFHSITPEGFEGRLEFLHQCTRQGPTVDGAANSRNTRNLSFGAPPICVLRIGDFFNTKILIENLSINYDNTTWDLNDEGVGVMPMMADIQIGFKFLGGSSLEGPIARLQNAVSFNYYANSEVHESRTRLYYDNKNDEQD